MSSLNGGSEAWWTSEERMSTPRRGWRTHMMLARVSWGWITFSYSPTVSLLFGCPQDWMKKRDGDLWGPRSHLFFTDPPVILWLEISLSCKTGLWSWSDCITRGVKVPRLGNLLSLTSPFFSPSSTLLSSRPSWDWASVLLFQHYAKLHPLLPPYTGPGRWQVSASSFLITHTQTYIHTHTPNIQAFSSVSSFPLVF